MVSITFRLSFLSAARLSVILALMLVFSGCGSRGSLMNPATDPVGADPGKKQVLVDVLPIDTYGFGNKQRKRLGLDVSAHFSAFEVAIRNRTDRAVQVSTLASRLRVALGTEYRALSREERQAYYRTGGREGKTVVIIPKSDRVTELELQRFEDLALRDLRLEPGEDATGLIYFKKVNRENCGEVVLSLEGIFLPGEEAPRPFQFNFRCPPRR